jgi:hypothetical protein
VLPEPIRNSIIRKQGPKMTAKERAGVVVALLVVGVFVFLLISALVITSRAWQ